MLSQGVFEEAVHEQSLALAVTFVLPDPPPTGTLAVLGASEKVQPAPVWVTAKVCPPIVSVALRDWLAGLAVAV